MIKVLKFGGTSVGSATNMRRVADIIVKESSTVTVLSAMSGTTDLLISISNDISKGNKEAVRKHILTLKNKYFSTIEELFDTSDSQLKAKMIVNSSISVIQSQIKNWNTNKSYAIVVAQGEIMTSSIFTLYLESIGQKAILLSALDFMRKDVEGMVDKSTLSSFFAQKKTSNETLYITQGFISLDSNGNIDNLGRGGSDYSAALIGAAIGASEVQIWTDIDGIHNNDPRYVENTRPIRRMSFDEAAELAYFGAKILHPATIQPCKDKGISVWLKNTMSPYSEGTIITNDELQEEAFHAVAAKDNITVIRISSARMLMAYGFLCRVFEVFERHRTPIDMITTSEVAIALTIDDISQLQEITCELKKFGTIEIEHNNSIVSIVGCMKYGSSGIMCRVMDSISNIPIKMISYGASHRSVSLLIDTDNKITTLKLLNEKLFS